jgi:uridine kinase
MRFRKNLSLLRDMAAKNLLTVERPELDLFLGRYESSGCEPVSHSSGYRESYRPHYRVVKASYETFFSVFQAAMKLKNSAAGGRPAILAVDGRCGSGKTFLAGLLSEVFNCSVFHLDDFFLKPEDRTAQRMGQPGGNIDRERFIKEVLQPLRRGEKVLFRPYSCLNDAALPAVEQQPGELAVVEGSYSLHPDFRDFYDYCVFLTCLPNVQQRRIFLRSDGKMLHNYLETWIPMEERYFKKMNVSAICDQKIDTSNFGSGSVGHTMCPT